MRVHPLAHLAGICMLAAACASAQRPDKLETQQSQSTGEANCELKAPPPNAGRSRVLGSNTLVHPMDAGANYTGCLWTWFMKFDGSVYAEAMLRFRRGELISYSSTERRSKTEIVTTHCVYRAARVVERTVQPSGQASTLDCPDANEMQSVIKRLSP